jgi:hypothetical protein
MQDLAPQEANAASKFLAFEGQEIALIMSHLGEQPTQRSQSDAEAIAPLNF